MMNGNLAYSVFRYYLMSTKWCHLPCKIFVTNFIFDLHGVKKTCANFDALVIIWTIAALNSPPSNHSSWWKRLEDVSKTSFIFVFRRPLQDFFKTSWLRLICSPYSNVFKTLWATLIYSSCKNVFKAFSRHLQDIFKTSSRHLQDVL